VIAAGTAPSVAAQVAAVTGVAGLRSVVLAASKDPNAKRAVLLFRPGGRWPLFALKLPTTDSAEAAVGREARLLDQLHQLDLGPLQQTVPRVVARMVVRGRAGLLTTAVTGSPMSRAFLGWRGTSSPHAVARHFHLAGSWLAAFQGRTATGPGPVEPAHGPGPRLLARFADHPGVEEVAGHLDDLRAQLGSGSTRRTAVHGDFWAGNLLAAPRGLGGVVDWEAAATAGDPVRDLAHFALTYALYLDRSTRPGRPVAGHPGLRSGEWGAGIVHALDGAGWFPDLLRGFLRDGLARLGVSPALWRCAALAGLAEIAATADHEEFARRHLDLLAGQVRWS
jgi:Phosphotransferase enzyme family